MEYWPIALSLVAIFISFYYYCSRKLRFFENHEILHVPPVPLFGNMGGLITKKYTMPEMVQVSYDLHPEAKYVGFYEFLTPLLIIRDPDLIKSITVKNFDNFQDHRGFVSEETDPLFNSILFNLKGDKWREERAILSPTFTSSKIKNMFVLMSDCAVRFSKTLAKLPEKERDVEMKMLLCKYTNDVIASCVYGVSVNTMEDPNNMFYVYGLKANTFMGFKNSLKMLMHRNASKLAVALQLRLIPTHVAQFFKDQLSGTIRAREESGIQRPDMVQLLMENTYKKTGGKGLSMDQLAAHAFVFYFGGFDSIASQTSLLTHLLAEYPDVQKRLQEEIDETMERTDGKLTYDVINEMRYLDAVINETLRLYPIASFMDRLCTKSFELPPALPGKKPFTVPIGMNVWLPVTSIHTDPKYYEDPHKFDPDRFMDNGRKILNSGTYIPFGIGPRVCIGNRFALIEIKVLMCHLLARCDIKVGARTVVPLQLEKGVLNVTVKGGYWLKLEPRANVHPSVETD